MLFRCVPLPCVVRVTCFCVFPSGPAVSLFNEDYYAKMKSKLAEGGVMCCQVQVVVVVDRLGYVRLYTLNFLYLYFPSFIPAYLSYSLYYLTPIQYITYLTPSVLGHIFTMSFGCDQMILLTLGRVYSGQSLKGVYNQIHN